MNRCPITYEVCDGDYSRRGLDLLSPKLTQLHEFPFGKKKQLELALEYSGQLSFSGIQSKLNASLSIEEQIFKIVGRHGEFIIKPQSSNYEELPENEDLTMKLADLAGIETPPHGLIYSKDRSLSYFIQRFDRKGKRAKIGVEDFAQLAGLSPDAKYDLSLEKTVELIEKFCSFPALEKRKFFLLVLFSFLVGNEDLHLKNLSILRHEGIVKLSPAYDLVNSTIVMNGREESALTLRGKKSRLTKEDFINYFGKERLKLSNDVLNKILLDLKESAQKWIPLIQNSFLSGENQRRYQALVKRRLRSLDFM